MRKYTYYNELKSCVLQFHELLIWIFQFFFLQTDLCGIKWRKWVWGEVVSYPPEPLQVKDPVLWSYSRCLSNDILCVWRRIGSPPNSQTPGVPAGGPLFDPLAGLTPTAAPVAPALSLTVAKELWIFWYGEEPILTDVISKELLSSSEYNEYNNYYVFFCFCFFD